MFDRARHFLQGAGLGAGLMYLLDPDRGRRRRALLRDQWDHLCHTTRDFLETARRDLANRLQGTRAAFQGRLRRDGADDRVLHERVRARLGRYVSHPHAIHVEAQDGHVVLSGQILSHEAPGLLAALASVRGVRDIENRLEPHDRAERVPALQGGERRTGQSLDCLQQNWAPATRLLAQAAGLTLMANCVVSRTITSTVFGTFGFGLFLRGLANRSVSEIAGSAGSFTARPASQQQGRHAAGATT